MNRFGYEPDFDNLQSVLRVGRGHRVPPAELVIDQELKEAFLGRPVVGVADEVEFRYQAGYDHAWISVGMIDPAGTVNRDLVCDSDDIIAAGFDALHPIEHDSPVASVGHGLEIPAYAGVVKGWKMNGHHRPSPARSGHIPPDRP